MKGSKEKQTFKSFLGLKALLETECFPHVSIRAGCIQHRKEDKFDQRNEAHMFKEAMIDVLPLSKRVQTNRLAGGKQPTPLPPPDASAEISRLKALIRDGTGFVVSQTPEYIEGTGYRVHRRMASRLHKGEFAIQADIDLHGFDVPSAKEAFDRFLKQALKTGKRGVLIVHGRGLSSPHEPVLKNKVFKWLSSGYWKKWIIAFSSARSCDGGAGATYVLLRSQVLKKIQRKKFNRGRMF